ncbi:aTP-dependent Clp protease proteolytic subunit 1 [Peribacillus asahii]|uniref:ATP-dependent Clp protease proteolytic subunit n=1 Tax=Peribacillus asahii TaxID=228899 RepID=A0A3T0KTW7_9BACI|nr:ATP-dependent Clp protease proteolytic subunit [Peribacillus asahii]AZV43713.1 aTP-dependent Clp protease proteolytic subunit 1 [Peribacillus asahii]
MKTIGFEKEYLELIQEMSTNLDDYQDWLKLKERKIAFNQEVDSSIIDRIVSWIELWNAQDDKAGLVGDDRPQITIEITSGGGDVITGFAAIDAIQKSKTKVVTKGIGLCASMGALLLMSGHQRIAYPNTVILIHDGSMAVSSTSKKAKNTMNFYDRLDERIKNFILANTKISAELYEEKEDEEWYMFADQEGIELGIVNEII